MCFDIYHGNIWSLQSTKFFNFLSITSIFPQKYADTSFLHTHKNVTNLLNSNQPISIHLCLDKHKWIQLWMCEYLQSFHPHMFNASVLLFCCRSMQHNVTLAFRWNRFPTLLEWVLFWKFELFLNRRKDTVLRHSVTRLPHGQLLSKEKKRC